MRAQDQEQLRDDLDFTRSFGSMSTGFEQRVQFALRQTEEDKTVKKPIFRTVAIVLALLTFVTAAFAAAFSRTTELFTWLGGPDKAAELNAGEQVVSGKTYQLGDVIYTLEDAVWTSEGLYCAITARPADGANIVLIPEDFDVTDPAGYPVHYKQRAEEIPADAPSYRDLAEASGAKLVQVKAHFQNAIDPNDESIDGDSGYHELPQHDGSIAIACQFYPVNVSMQQLRGGECEVLIRIANNGKALDGSFTDDPFDVFDWAVTIIPEG